MFHFFLSLGVCVLFILFSGLPFLRSACAIWFAVTLLCCLKAFGSSFSCFKVFQAFLLFRVIFIFSTSDFHFCLLLSFTSCIRFCPSNIVLAAKGSLSNSCLYFSKVLAEVLSSPGTYCDLHPLGMCFLDVYFTKLTNLS